MSVQWLEEVNGVVQPLEVTETDFLDVTPHREFNSLSVGAHVSKVVTTCTASGFLFGTIIQIRRYNYGQVSQIPIELR